MPLTGTPGDDHLDDLIGSYDAITGLEGNDVLQGGASGGVLLDGGPGADYLDSYGAGDRLRGGTGPDVFDFFAGNNPVLADFSPAEGDVIAINASAFKQPLKLGRGLTEIQPKQLLSGGKGSRIKGKSPLFTYDQSKGVLAFDPDGKGKSRSIALITFEGALPTSNELLTGVRLFDGDLGSPLAQAYFDAYRTSLV
jgi:Ca2+-binding RTX toxin-like protein